MEFYPAEGNVKDPSSHQNYNVGDVEFEHFDHMMGVEEPHQHENSPPGPKGVFLSTEEGSSIGTTVSPESITHQSPRVRSETTYKQSTFATVSTKTMAGLDPIWTEEVIETRMIR